MQVGTSPLDDGLFAWLDTSGDGRLTARELDTAGGRLGELDANHDRLVTSAEIPERLAVVVYRGAADALRDRRRWRAAGGEPPVTNAPAWLTAMDRNGDGELSRHEFLGTARQFSAIDRNADGVIDPQEARDTESAGTAGRVVARMAMPGRFAGDCSRSRRYDRQHRRAG